MKIVNNDLLKEITVKSANSPRKRANAIFHKFEDRVQRMIQVLQPGTYAQPHRHKDPDKVEMFIILKGKLAVVEFNDNGDITESVILDGKSGLYAAEIAPGTWHSIVSLAKDTSVVEILEGPYEEMSHKKFASWAPKEGTPQAEVYLRKLKKLIG